jgi:hypothetical protein
MSLYDLNYHHVYIWKHFKHKFKDNLMLLKYVLHLTVDGEIMFWNTKRTENKKWNQFLYALENHYFWKGYMINILSMI